MSKAMRLTATVFGALVGVAAMVGPAAAQSAVNVGTLTCNVASGWGFIFGSSKALNCTFAGVGGRYEHYTGNITKFGADIGYTSGGVLVWTVVAPVAAMVPGSAWRDLCGRHGQRDGRRRRRRQCADRRLEQHDRAAAAQHRRQYRAQRRRRHRRDPADPGAVTASGL